MTTPDPHVILTDSQRHLLYGLAWGGALFLLLLAAAMGRGQ